MSTAPWRRVVCWPALRCADDDGGDAEDEDEDDDDDDDDDDDGVMAHTFMPRCAGDVQWSTIGGNGTLVHLPGRRRQSRVVLATVQSRLAEAWTVVRLGGSPPFVSGFRMWPEHIGGGRQ
eukprot:COSAG01_NODE_10068_length_2257_cov_1.042632_3_plen_119_part_01